MRELRTVKHFYEAGKLQEVEDDVLNIVRKIKDISPRLKVFWNDYKGCFTITETSLDGAEERLVLHAELLDERVIDRLLVADQWRGREDPDHVLPDSEDFLTRIEQEQDAADQEDNRLVVDKLMAHREAMASYADHDGKGTKSQILVPRGFKHG